MRRATPPEEMLEAEWTTQAVGTQRSPGLARQLGWWAYHTLRSRGSQPGYPDWTLLRERLVYLELKTEARGSRLTEAQRDVARRIRKAGVEIYIARPTDLEDLALVLAARRYSKDGWSREARDAGNRLRSRLDEELARP